MAVGAMRRIDGRHLAIYFRLNVEADWEVDGERGGGVQDEGVGTRVEGVGEDEYSESNVSCGRSLGRGEGGG